MSAHPADRLALQAQVLGDLVDSATYVARRPSWATELQELEAELYHKIRAKQEQLVACLRASARRRRREERRRSRR